MAVMPAAGLSFEERRQSVCATLTSLSWLKFASACMIVPSSPARTMRRSSSMALSKRRSWPMPRTTPALAQASTERSASSRVSASGFSQKTWSPRAAAAATCAVWRLLGVQRMTQSSRSSAIKRSKSP